MEFVREKVLDILNKDEAIIGSKGYFSNDLRSLKDRVEAQNKIGFGVLFSFRECDPLLPFYKEEEGEQPSAYSFFYPVEIPKKKKYRPFNDIQELKDVFCERFNMEKKPRRQRSMANR